MIFTHPNLSHIVNDGFEYTIAGLSTGETVVARFGAKTTFKHNGRRVTRAAAFEIVNADAARIERIARETDELVAYGVTEREAANIAAVDTRAKSEALAAARAAARAARPSRAKMWAEVDTLARAAAVEEAAALAAETSNASNADQLKAEAAAAGVKIFASNPGLKDWEAPVWTFTSRDVQGAGAAEAVEAPAAPARPRPRMSDAQIAESRAAFREFAALAAETSGVAVAEEAAPLTPAARLAEIHADIDAANKARLDAAFAASDANPDRLSTEGPEFEERRARAFEQFPELAEAALVADLETRVDAAANHARDQRFTVEALDPAGVSGISAEELVAQTVGPAVQPTPRVALAALALRMARNGWSVHQLGDTPTGYRLAASVQPPYGGPIIAAADVIDGNLIAALYGPLGEAVPLRREAFIEAAIATSRPA